MLSGLFVIWRCMINVINIWIVVGSGKVVDVIVEIKL